MNNYINIGKIAATFGIKGELLLIHALGKKTIFNDVEALFIEERKGSYLPYFIEQAKAKSAEESIIQLEGIITKESAHRFISKQVWLTEEDFRKLAGKRSPILLIGYQLINDGENIGKVEEVIEQPHQVLLRLFYGENEAFIPLHEETLEKIDHKTKEIFVILPEGLLDVYK